MYGMLQSRSQPHRRQISHAHFPVRSTGGNNTRTSRSRVGLLKCNRFDTFIGSVSAKCAHDVALYEIDHADATGCTAHEGEGCDAFCETELAAGCGEFEDGRRGVRIPEDEGAGCVAGDDALSIRSKLTTLDEALRPAETCMVLPNGSCYGHTVESLEPARTWPLGCYRSRITLSGLTISVINSHVQDDASLATRLQIRAFSSIPPVAIRSPYAVAVALSAWSVSPAIRSPILVSQR